MMPVIYQFRQIPLFTFAAAAMLSPRFFRYYDAAELHDTPLRDTSVERHAPTMKLPIHISAARRQHADYDISTLTLIVATLTLLMPECRYV